MPIDQLLKRHFWAVIVALVALAAFFDAQGIMHIVGAAWARTTRSSPPPRCSRAAAGAWSATPARDERGADPLAQPFDSVTGR